MVAAIAFACIQSDGVAVRRVQFSAEFKACLPFLRFSGLGHEPIDTVPIEAVETAGEGIEQHLHIAHAATAAITLPPLAFLRYVSDGPCADPTIYLRAFGICLLDRGAPSRPADAFSRTEFRAIERPLDRLADVVDHVVRYGEHRSGEGDSPFCFAASRADPLGDRAALEGVADLKIIAPRKVRALLLAEPPSYGRECRLRLYIDTNRPRPSAPVITVDQVRARTRAPAKAGSS
jgi:hypothetical protein